MTDVSHDIYFMLWSIKFEFEVRTAPRTDRPDLDKVYIETAQQIQRLLSLKFFHLYGLLKYWNKRETTLYIKFQYIY